MFDLNRTTGRLSTHRSNRKRNNRSFHGLQMSRETGLRPFSIRMFASPPQRKGLAMACARDREPKKCYLYAKEKNFLI
ncbi:hypothetical protein TNCV_4141411 [Trichonephila clavipes]|nr:hypothetical protein TNCV_4141411 [Trichonephila clavipes]